MIASHKHEYFGYTESKLTHHNTNPKRTFFPKKMTCTSCKHAPHELRWDSNPRHYACFSTIGATARGRQLGWPSSNLAPTNRGKADRVEQARVSTQTTMYHAIWLLWQCYQNSCGESQPRCLSSLVSYWLLCMIMYMYMYTCTFYMWTSIHTCIHVQCTLSLASVWCRSKFLWSLNLSRYSLRCTCE